MTTVKVSPKFQVVIPKEVRRSMKLKPGQKFRVIQYEHCIELVPVEPPRNLRGFLKGMPLGIPREHEDRL